MKVIDGKTKNTLESDNPVVVKSWQDDPKRFKITGEQEARTAAESTGGQRTKKE